MYALAYAEGTADGTAAADIEELQSDLEVMQASLDGAAAGGAGADVNQLIAAAQQPLQDFHHGDDRHRRRL